MAIKIKIPLESIDGKITNQLYMKIVNISNSDVNTFNVDVEYYYNVIDRKLSGERLTMKDLPLTYIIKISGLEGLPSVEICYNLIKEQIYKKLEGYSSLDKYIYNL